MGDAGVLEEHYRSEIGSGTGHRAPGGVKSCVCVCEFAKRAKSNTFQLLNASRTAWQRHVSFVSKMLSEKQFEWL